MICRLGCGACCIAPSINTPIPNMPNGKLAGQACVNLDLQNFSCQIWQQDNYPELCKKFRAEESICGSSQEDAIRIINNLESITSTDAH